MAAERRLYFDANAGAVLRPSALAAMQVALVVGNASSVHREGRAARRLVEDARRQVAELVGVTPDLLTFTSGGTEANVTALSPDMTIRGANVRFDRLLVSAVEHPSVLSGGRFPVDQVKRLPVDNNGSVEVDGLRQALAQASAAGEQVMVSVMLANNETGVIQPVAELAAIVHAAGALIHCDAIQAAGRVPIDIAALGVDLLTLSAHKLGGAQGAGALVRASDHIVPKPLLTGGGQERYARAGTENVAAIAAFGAASREARADLDRTADWTAWRDRLAAGIAGNGSRVLLVGADAKRLPQTLLLVVDGVPAETLVMALDLAGVAVSAGSACSSGKVARSHVLTAMGYADSAARSGVRISFGWETSESDIDELAETWRQTLGRIRAGDNARAA